VITNSEDMKNALYTLVLLLIVSSTFGQTTWYEISTGTTSKLNAIDFPSPNVGYIAGEDSTILKSIDGGQTWTQLGLNGIGISGLDDDFTDIDFVDENVGFIVCGYSGTYRTLDGGQSWTLMTGQTSNMCFPHTVYPFSETDFFSGGAGCFEGAIIDHYVNGTWTTGNLGLNFWDSNQTLLEMSFSDNNRGVAATRGEQMLRTVDGGVNWDTISVNVPDRLTSVVMVNDTLCYAGYEDLNAQGFGILTSIDGGLTWTQDINSATFYYPSYLCVHAADNGDVYSGGFSSNSPGGLIFESTDGTTWDYQTVGQPINDMTSYDSDVTFGVGDNGYLVVNTPPASLSLGTIEPIEFNMYPNPFQNEIIINNESNEKITATLIDVNGKVLKTQVLVSGETIFNCEELSKGVYLIEIEQGYTRTIKRIIKQ
jgi:photosystem II stability/assembly factor-like uncharacterized protein